jgi:hypothetical protein
LIVMKRSPVLFVFAPVALYLVVLVVLAATYLHPPLWGWIGLIALAATALATATLAVYALPRMGSNTVRQHPRPGSRYRLLVVIDGPIDADELRSAVRLRLVARRSEVRVVAPVLATPLDFLSGNEEREQRAAERHLDAALTALAREGIAAWGSVGADDPLQAVGDALVSYPADEILFLAPVQARRGWLDRDFEGRARDAFGLPVSTVLVGFHTAAAVWARPRLGNQTASPTSTPDRL